MDDKRFFSRVGFSYFMMVVLTVAVSGIGVEIKQLLKKTGGNLNEISNGTFI